MKILVDHARPNEDDQTIFFTLTDDNDVSYNWHADIPLDADPQTYAEGKIEEYLCGIRRKEYPEAPNLTTLEEWEQWIADGCKIQVQAGTDEEGNPIYEERVVEKKPFKNTW